ncbi:MAG TPA: ABC transporter substrate-binding protein [Symbiobacteriaceae bacterium]|jgi:branched-chain amino acid transport system substrate-binding protein
MTSKRILSAVLAFITVSSLVVGCGTKKTEQPAAGSTPEAPKVAEIKIAFFNPLSGSNGDAGKQDLDGVQLAVEDINNAGGIKALGGAKIKLVVTDTTSEPKDAVSAVERTLSNEKVVAAIGPGISNIALAITPLLEKNKVPIIVNAINDGITEQGYKYTFQSTPKGGNFGNTQVEFLKYLNATYNLGLKDVAIVYENSAYGESTSKGSMEIAKNAGLNVVLYQSYPAGFTDASSLVTAIKNSKAQVLFPVSYTNDAKLIINTMKQFQISPLIIGGGAGFLWPAIYKEMGDSVNGLISVGSWNWDSKAIQDDSNLSAATARFEKKYGYFMTEHAGPEYAATMLVAQAMEKTASADPTKIRDYLAATEFGKGTFGGFMQPGVTKYNEKGWNSNVHPVMIQWQGGKPRTIYPAADAVAKLQFEAKK